MINKVYKMTFKRNLKLSFFIILIMLIAPVLGLVIYLSQPNHPTLLKLLLITFAGTGILWIPGMILHLSYYLKDKGKAIRMTNECIEITKLNVIKKIIFRDINQVISIDNSCIARSPWNDYGFVRLTMKDKSVEKITCLTVDPFTLTLELSRRTSCGTEKRCVGIPFLFL